MMANRVLLDANGMKISRPGVNVLTASNANLLFSSDWSAYTYLTGGTYTVSFGTGLTGSSSGTIAYGTTTSGRQIVTWEKVVGGEHRALGNISGFYDTLVADMYTGSTYRGTARWVVSAVANPASIAVSWSWDRGGRSNIVLPDYVFRWSLFSYNF